MIQFSNLSGVTDGALDWLTRFLSPVHYQHWLSVLLAWFAIPIVFGSVWFEELLQRSKVIRAKIV